MPGPPPPPPPALQFNNPPVDPPKNINALLSSIQQGTKLKKTVTNDRSTPVVPGGAPPASSAHGSASTNPAASHTNPVQMSGMSAIFAEMQTRRKSSTPNSIPDSAGGLKTSMSDLQQALAVPPPRPALTPPQLRIIDKQPISVHPPPARPPPSLKSSTVSLRDNDSNTLPNTAAPPRPPPPNPSNIRPNPANVPNRSPTVPAVSSAPSRPPPTPSGLNSVPNRSPPVPDVNSAPSRPPPMPSGLTSAPNRPPPVPDVGNVPSRPPPTPVENPDHASMGPNPTLPTRPSPSTIKLPNSTRRPLPPPPPARRSLPPPVPRTQKHPIAAPAQHSSVPPVLHAAPSAPVIHLPKDDWPSVNDLPPPRPFTNMNKVYL